MDAFGHVSIRAGADGRERSEDRRAGLRFLEAMQTLYIPSVRDYIRRVEGRAANVGMFGKPTMVTLS